MSFSVLWTLLPKGFNASKTKLQLSLVASPRAVNETGVLDPDSDLVHWPTVANRMTDLTVVTAEPSERTPATRISDLARQDIWDALVPRSIKVKVPTTADTPIFIDTGSSFSYRDATDAAERLYLAAMQDNEQFSRVLHPVKHAIAGLQAWILPPGKISSAVASAAQAVRAPAINDLLDPKQLTSARVQQAATMLRSQGHSAAADVIPLIPILRRLKVASPPVKSAGTRPPGKLDKIETIAVAELHQVLGLLLDHPSLASITGLRIDLEIDTFRGERLIRIGDAAGEPLNGPVAIPQPWSAVSCDPAAGLFVMQTQPNSSGTEVINGMLDMQPDPTTTRYFVTDIDPVGVAAQLAAVAASAGNAGQEPPDALPARRDAGIVIAQTDRKTKAFAHNLTRNSRFDSGKGPAEVKGAPVLFADDVTAGYRFDVASGDGAFHSLMRRKVRYSFSSLGSSRADETIDVSDEGVVEPFVPVEQRDENDQPQLFIGEELLRWTGFSAAVRPPGPAVGAQSKTDPHVVDPDRKPLPHAPLLIDVEVEPGTLTKLRYGLTYRFRARAVDLAGNSIDPSVADPRLTTAPFRFRRRESVAPPALVPRRAFDFGESLVHLVARSDDGQPFGLPCERHLVAPKSSQRLAERHGVFDVAFGSNATRALRDRMLAIGKREQGSIRDPVVVATNGTSVAAQGIAVVKNRGAGEATATLPVPRGEPFPAGEYVVHDTDEMRIPYLPDVASNGSAWRGLPGIPQPIVVPWTGSWPDVEPHRLIVKAAATDATRIVPPAKPGARPTLEVDVAPGNIVTAYLSSAVSLDAIAVMDVIDPTLRKAALNGQVATLSPRQQVVFVHAVRKPLQAAELVLNPQEPRKLHSTAARFSGTVTAHSATTSKVDIEGTWDEVIDRGLGPVLFEKRRSVAASLDVLKGNDGPLLFDDHHQFGDKKRRRISFRTAATTSFREYFSAPVENDRSLIREGNPVVIDVPATSRPEPPRIHSVLPLLRATRNVVNGKLTSATGSVGFRVWLHRPWFTTGFGEMLGVSLVKDQASGNALTQQSKLELLSRWGVDPYESAASSVTTHLTPEAIKNRTAVVSPVLLPGDATGNGLGHAIAGIEVAFDADRNLWFADIEFDFLTSLLGSPNGNLVRLALTRLQPNSLVDSEVDVRTSSVVVTDFLPILPSHKLTAERVGSNAVRVTVSGSFRNTSKLTAKWQRRMLDPLDTVASDIFVDGVEFELTQPGANVSLREATLTIGATTPPEPLQAGRIVVEEILRGWSVTEPKEQMRPVWVDTFDLRELGLHL